MLLLTSMMKTQKIIHVVCDSSELIALNCRVLRALRIRLWLIDRYFLFLSIGKLIVILTNCKKFSLSSSFCKSTRLSLWWPFCSFFTYLIKNLSIEQLLVIKLECWNVPIHSFSMLRDMPLKDVTLLEMVLYLLSVYIFRSVKLSYYLQIQI